MVDLVCIVVLLGILAERAWHHRRDLGAAGWLMYVLAALLLGAQVGN